MLFGRIRAALDTPIVNSIWRRVASEGRLEAVWDQLEPQAAGTRERARDLRSAAMHASLRDLPWEVVADPSALRSAAVEDAAPGTTAVLHAYATTLARVLTLVASCRPPASGGRSDA